MPSVSDLVRTRLTQTLGGPIAEAGVTFLGARPLRIARIGPDPAGLVHYASIGTGEQPMHAPTAVVLDPVRGPRAELLLSLSAARDEVLHTLAVLAATPQVEGLVLAAGTLLDLRRPLWPGSRFSGVLLAGSGCPVDDLDLAEAGLPAGSDGIEPVRFLPVLPITAAEAALARARGAQHLLDRWQATGTDLHDPDRNELRDLIDLGTAGAAR